MGDLLAMLKNDSMIPRISRGDTSLTYVGTALCMIPVAKPTTIYIARTVGESQRY